MSRPQPLPCSDPPFVSLLLVFFPGRAFGGIYQTGTGDVAAPVRLTLPGSSSCKVSCYGVSGSSNKLIFGAGTWLADCPYITNPDPAVYQLKSPKSNKTSVCLATDFDSQNNVPEVTDSLAYSTNSTVLDMKATDSKSNGMLVWSSRIDFECKDAFNQIFHPDSEFPCDAKLAEQSFETDMNLNFQNLLVIGFRLLLLKVVGFNLLMTLRLWSS